MACVVVMCVCRGMHACWSSYPRELEEAAADPFPGGQGQGGPVNDEGPGLALGVAVALPVVLCFVWKGGERVCARTLVRGGRHPRKQIRTQAPLSHLSHVSVRPHLPATVLHTLNFCSSCLRR